jgi:hypothetical protein
MKLIKVEMIQTVKGSDRDAEGIAMPIKIYKEKEKYEISEYLANIFKEAGYIKKGKK